MSHASKTEQQSAENKIAEMARQSRIQLVMANKYKSTITDLEIQNASLQVIIEDMRAKIESLEAEKDAAILVASAPAAKEKN